MISEQSARNGFSRTMILGASQAAAVRASRDDPSGPDRAATGQSLAAIVACTCTGVMRHNGWQTLGDPEAKGSTRGVQERKPSDFISAPCPIATRHVLAWSIGHSPVVQLNQIRQRVHLTTMSDCGTVKESKCCKQRKGHLQCIR